MGYDAFTDLGTEKGTVTFGSFGSPESYTTFDETIKGIKPEYSGTLTHDKDFVGEVLGDNVGVNGTRGIESYFDIINPNTYINIFNLFTDSSPHSTYYCAEAGKFKCGG